ncbi:MAG: ribosomal protein S18-alanine N-acetyltransferase [Gammaproteobacteria bacterium]|nr:ribosomal protein S18-alanine N-acetyltransferase [Gammaproteobacteria bacterium]
MSNKKESASERRYFLTRRRPSDKQPSHRRPPNNRRQVSFRIRPMHETDIPMIMRLENQCYAYPWAAWMFRSAIWLRMSCWVMEGDREVIGFGIAQRQLRWWHLMNVCIAANFRAMGLGKKMTVHLLSEARKQHAVYSWLEVRPNNRTAINLYRSLGFRSVTMRKNYYPSRRGRLPAIVMAKKLYRKQKPNIL